MMTDEEMYAEARRLIKISITSFIVSFLIGTLLIWMHVNMNLKHGMDIITTGFLFTVIAFFFNSVIYLNTIVCASRCSKYRSRLLLSSLLLLCNLPIANYYLKIFLNH